MCHQNLQSQEPRAPVKASSEKSDNIDHLRATFEKDMERKIR